MNKYVDKIKLIYLSDNIYNPKTGGQIFDSKAIAQLQNNGFHVVTKSIFDLSKGIRKSHIISNLHIFFNIATSHHDVIVESAYYSSQLFICNLLLKLFLRTKIVVVVQDVRVDASWFKKMASWRKRVQKIIISIFLKSADLIFVNSEYTKKYILSYGINKNIKIINPPLNINSSSVKKNTQKNHKQNILCVANIRHDKGQEYLIEAFNKISIDNVHLDLAGEIVDTEYYKKLLKLTKKYEIEERISFHKWCNADKLSQLYSEATMFVLPTLWEAYGLVLIEAMSFGLPIIASNIGGIPEIIKNGINGILVPPGDSEKLARSIKEILINEGLRKKMSCESYNYYKNYINTNNSSLNEFCQTIEEICTNNR